MTDLKQLKRLLTNILRRENHEYQGISGNELSEQEAKKRAKEIFQLEKDTELTITKTGKGAELGMYSASYQLDNKNGYLDLSVKGGHPLSLMINREVKEPQISLHEAMNKASEYLKEHDFDNMELFQSSQYDNVGVFNFLYSQDDIKIYPDSIQVKVGLDNGEILGFSSRDYFRNHQDRDIPEPELTMEEAKEKVNPNVEVQDQHIAVIENDLNEEVLAYVFLGVLENDTYRIFIDANTGVEAQVEKLKNAESKFQQSM